MRHPISIRSLQSYEDESSAGEKVKIDARISALSTEIQTASSPTPWILVWLSAAASRAQIASRSSLPPHLPILTVTAATSLVLLVSQGGQMLIRILSLAIFSLALPPSFSALISAHATNADSATPTPQSGRQVSSNGH